MIIDKHRDNTMDCMKGLAIILVVIGHAGPKFVQVSRWISMFHMGLFFMISGYLWNPDNSKNKKAVKGYIIRKVKSLYIPYIIFNGLMILLNNFFIYHNIYTNNVEFLQIGGRGSQFGLIQYMNISDILIQLVKTVLFMGGSQLGGATWFLRILFVVSVLNCSISFWTNKYFSHKYEKAIVYAIVFFACCLGVTAFNNFNIRIPIESINVFFSELCLAFPAYLLGGVLKKYNHILFNRIYTPFTLSISFALLVLFDNDKNIISFSNGIVPNVCFYLGAIILGWIMVMTLSLSITGKLKCAIAYIGQKSLTIMLFHLLSFKLVTLIYLIIYKGKWFLLASFPYLDWDSDYLWLFYTWVGIDIPIKINHIYEKIKKCVSNI